MTCCRHSRRTLSTVAAAADAQRLDSHHKLFTAPRAKLRRWFWGRGASGAPHNMLSCSHLVTPLKCACCRRAAKAWAARGWTQSNAIARVYIMKLKSCLVAIIFSQRAVISCGNQYVRVDKYILSCFFHVWLAHLVDRQCGYGIVSTTHASANSKDVYFSTGA
jgi:hypothetical protein